MLHSRIPQPRKHPHTQASTPRELAWEDVLQQCWLIRDTQRDERMRDLTVVMTMMMSKGNIPCTTTRTCASGSPAPPRPREEGLCESRGECASATARSPGAPSSSSSALCSATPLPPHRSPSRAQPLPPVASYFRALLSFHARFTSIFVMKGRYNLPMPLIVASKRYHVSSK